LVVRRSPYIDHLPRTDVIHDLPENEKICPEDGTELKHIGDECSEQLNYIPAKINVLRYVPRKYACPCCQTYLITAPKPPQPIERSIAAPMLLAPLPFKNTTMVYLHTNKQKYSSG
jgi:transposase